MNIRFLIAGFGGQGVMLIGQMMGYAATKAGISATFYPSYGPEQRGGAANCSVVIADGEIGSPVVTRPDVLVCFNATAFDKFSGTLAPGGTLFVNSSLVTDAAIPSDVEIVRLPLFQMAEEAGSAKVGNIIMLGAVIQKTGAIPMSVVEATMLEKLGKKPALLEINKRALQMGADAVK